jgi:two-component system sensor histidine kinase BaeS
MDLRKEEVHLGDLIVQVLEPFRPRFEAKGIRVGVNVAEAGRTVRGDLRYLSQVVQNLLENAWQYTEPEGEVSVRAEGLPGAVKVLFANTGGELEEKDLPFLFERFYRGEKSRSRDRGGAGIGLAIVKGLIEAHGGRVGAELAQKMTVIWFTLPL